MEGMLTIGDAAAELGVSAQTLRRWDAQGKLRAHRHPLNGYRLYAQEELDALHNRTRTTPASSPSPVEIKEPATLAGLTHDDRVALAQCSHFAGGWNLEDAAAIVELSRTSDGDSLAKHLTALSRHSLVQQDGQRFKVNAAIAVVAREGLPSADRRRLHERHGRYYAALAKRCSESRSTAALTRLAESAPDLDQAFDWCVDQDRIQTAVLAADIAIAMARLVEHSGTTPRAVERIDIGQALASRFGLSDGLRAWLCAERGRLAYESDDLTAARQMHRLALSLGEAAEDLEVQVVALSQLGQMALMTEGPEAAETWLARAHTLAQRTAHPWFEGLVAGVRANALLRGGERALARDLFERCRALSRLVGDRVQEAMALGILGNIDQDVGLTKEARRAYERTVALFSEAHAEPGEAIFRGYLGTALQELGDVEGARHQYERALPTLEARGMKRFEALFRAALGALEAGQGRASSAEKELHCAHELCLALPEPIQRTAHLHQGHLDLHRARACHDNAQQALHLLRAWDRMSGSDGSTDDERFAHRCLERALVDSSHLADPTSGPSLRIGPFGQWFHLGGERVDLSKRSALPRILWRLLRARLETPGQALQPAQLIASGWPGERMREEAGAHRLRVAIATLRRLGLLGEILTRGQGYCLNSETPVGLGPWDRTAGAILV